MLRLLMQSKLLKFAKRIILIILQSKIIKLVEKLIGRNDFLLENHTSPN